MLYETAEREAGNCTQRRDRSGGGAMPAGGQGASLKPRIKAPVPLKMWPGLLLSTPFSAGDENLISSISPNSCLRNAIAYFIET